MVLQTHMNFGKLGKVETAQTYLDIAFNQAKEYAKESAKTITGSQFQRFQRRELGGINKVHTALVKHLQTIVQSFPAIDNLDPFYRALVSCVVDVAQLKQSLGGVNWAAHRVEDLFREYNAKLRGSRDDTMVLRHKRAFYGRISSVVKKLQKDFVFLDEARKTMKELPTLKTSIPTIVIAGLPNVGKSTLLRALTGSAPAIASYPFTTKQLMLGYRTHNEKKWQFIDTPGLLDRPLAKRNPIEKQAALALQHLAKVVLFVIDPTESCGYPLKEQKNLMKEISKTLNVPVIIILNKADIARADQVAAATEGMQNVALVSADKEQGINDVVERVEKVLGC